MKENKRQIIKTKAGEMGYIDTHFLSKCLINTKSKTQYLVMASCTRMVWAEVVEDIKSLTVMFAVLKCFNILADHYDIRFKEVLIDNGPEFGVKHSTKKAGYPFERTLIELGIKHRCMRPYRPQTNGKAERF